MDSSPIAVPVAASVENNVRNIVFISKGTPNDDEFTLWLAPRLEAAGYTVFADILDLQGGDRWRKELTETLQKRAVKMLLCCQDSTLAKNGVQEEIGIAEDLAKELGDKRFIIPLRLKNFKKLFGIGGLQYVDFERSWAKGLIELLELLERQGVPCDKQHAVINPNWELYRKRHSLELIQSPETLTSNWLRVAAIPSQIRYCEPKGAIDHSRTKKAYGDARFPFYLHNRGVFTFLTAGEMKAAVRDLGSFEEIHSVSVQAFAEEGIPELGLQPREAKNILVFLFKAAWQNFCTANGFLEYQYSKTPGFHVGKAKLPIGKKIPWGRQGSKRSAMLRNVAKGKVWQFGISAIPFLWPYFHFRLKSRVLFAEFENDKEGPLVADEKQFRLRRSICKGWRNKQWHGRLMAFLELMAGERAYIDLPVSPTESIRLDSAPLLFTSPVTTPLPNLLEEEDEDSDPSVLGHRDIDQEAAE